MIKDEDKPKERLLKKLAALRGRIAELEAGDGEDTWTEKAAHPQQMLLALSQASQAVQRARTPEAVQDAIGEQVVRLGLDATVLVLNDERTHLRVASHTINPHLVHAAKRLSGLSAKGYRFPLTPGGFHHGIMASGETTFVHQGIAPLAHILPRAARPLAGRLMGLFDRPQSIIAPLTLDHEAQGLLAISGPSLTEADMPAVTTFANQAAIAMDNARVYQAERDTKERLRRLTSDLQDAREEERTRMARRIHDELGQTLTALKLDLYQCTKGLLEKPYLYEKAKGMTDLIDDAIRTVQRLSTELRPGLLNHLGLGPSLEWQAEQFRERTGLVCDLSLSEEGAPIEPHVATALFRIFQETLTNVTRHAGASEVHVELATDPYQVVLKVRDDGRGITQREISSPQSLGLLGMRERTRMLGGEITFEGAQGQGTTVTVCCGRDNDPRPGRR